jgi:hypothetical protein
MASNGYSITISATDQASKTIDKINKQIASIRAPVERIQNSIAKFSDVSGLKSVSKAFTDLTRSSWGAFQNISRIVDPLGVIAGAGSIAGIAALERNFATLGQTLTNTGRLMNMDPAKLAQWENAGKLVGVAVSDTDASLRGLQKTATDARFGQNNQAAGMLQTILGKNWREESKDIPGTIMKISKYLGTLSTSARANAIGNIEGYFSMGDGFTSSLLRGPAALQANLKKAAALGSPSDSQIASGDSLAQSINAAQEAVANLGTTIGSKLAPVLGPMIDNFTKWTAANRNLISSDVTKIVSGFAKVIASINYDAVFKHMQHAFDLMDKVAKSVGGWQNAIEGVIAILTASKVASIALPFVQLSSAISMLSSGGAGSFMALGAALKGIGFGFVGGQIVKLGVGAAGGSAGLANVAGDTVQGAITGGAIFGLPGAAIGGALGAAYGAYQNHQQTMAQVNARADAMTKYYRSQGLSAVQSAGLVGGFQRESSLDPTAQSGDSYGIGQWLPARQADFQKIFGHPIQSSTLGEQMQFSLDELFKGKEAAAGAALRASTTLPDAVAASLKYERPLNVGAGTAIGMTNGAEILSRNAPQYLPKIDPAGNAGPFPPDNEPGRLLGAPIAPVGEGVGADRQRLIIDFYHHKDGTVTQRERKSVPGVTTRSPTQTAMPAVAGL